MMIHHLAITTSDPERLAGFYETIPGLSVIRRNKEGGMVRSVWLSGDDQVILMIEQGDPKGAFALVFDMFEESGNKKQRDLSEILPLEEERTEFTLYFRDPDGNRLGFSSYPEPLSRFGI